MAYARPVRPAVAVRFRTHAWLALLLVVTAVPGRAQIGASHDRTRDSAGAARLRSLNNQLLALHGRMQAAAPAEAALLRAQAATTIEQRTAALAALAQQDARQALSFAFSPELLAELAARFPEQAGQLESHGTWRGPVEYLIVDDPAQGLARAVQRISLGERSVEVRWATREPAGLKSGDLLEVSGVLAGNMLAASGGSVQGSALAGGSCSTTGVQNTAVLLVTFPGAPLPTSVTPQSVHDIFFGTTGRSLDGYWREASYGQASAAGDVFGWYTLTGSYTCATINQMRDDAIAAASAAGVNFQNYRRVFVVFPDQLGCGWAGMATLGCSTQNSPAGSFTASLAYLVDRYLGERNQAVQLVTHEAGHSLGLHHASSRDFGAEALGPVGAEGMQGEYGDSFSTAGWWNLGHYGAAHKAMLNWLAGGSGYSVVQGGGSWSLLPLAASPGGLQALKIQRGTGNDWIWVEYRQPLGSYDSTLSTQPFAGALIHYEDSFTGSRTHLLDFNPSTDSWLDPALVAGQGWADPYTNLSLSVQSAAASGLTVSVNYGATPCTQASPTLIIAPLNPNIFPGGTASYEVTLTNNDAPGCAAETFSFSSGLPAGWPTAFSVPSLTLSPGQSARTTMGKTGPAGTPPGTYQVDASATRGASTTSTTANCTVMAAPAPLAVGVTLPGTSYLRRSVVPITAIATSGTLAASGASLLFTLTRADGSRVTKKLIADSNGAATWNYRIGPKDPTGTASVTAQATYSGQTAASIPAIFIVQ